MFKIKWRREGKKKISEDRKIISIELLMVSQLNRGLRAIPNVFLSKYFYVQILSIPLTDY